MPEKQKRYGMLIDLNRCVGCYACQVTCKAEYDIPFGTFRCRVETYRSGEYPHIEKFFLPRLCNHCDNAPCIEVCEEKALYKNQDGIVIINNADCTGCGLCHEKCPYNAIEIIPINGQAEKCDFCYERRILKGLFPVCVSSCMGKAITFGDINDEKSDIAMVLKKEKIKALNPDFKTNPSVFYLYKGDVLDSPLRDHGIPGEAHSTQRVFVDEKSFSAPDNPKSKIVYTSDAMCPSECGISVLVEDGIAKKIYGNPHTLINNGAFCAKGASGLQLTYSPHRIKTPLIRTGQRGEDKWRPVTWEEACDHISRKLIKIKKDFGPESVFLDCGDVTDREAYYRLFHIFGTPNIYNHGSICDSNRRWGQGLMLGDERPLPDVQRPVLIRNNAGEMHLKTGHDIKLLINLGANPLVATRFNYMSYGIPAAREENGCIYIVVDPAHTNSAAHADIWLAIRPGTDAELLAAMLYYIIKYDSSGKQYIDHGFISKYTLGWKEFKEAFLAYTRKIDPSNNLSYFSLEWAEEKTGLHGEDIKKVAHLFGITKPAAIEMGMHGAAHHTNGDVTSILMTALCLVTGNVDRPGGLVFIETQKVKRGNKTIGKEFLEKTVVRDINGRTASGKLSELNKDLYGDYPSAWKGVLADLPSKIREGIKLKHGPFKGHHYPVKAFITRAGNPVMTAGSTPDWTEALSMKQGASRYDSFPRGKGQGSGGGGQEASEYVLELMVFIDTHITMTGRYVDVILPEAGFLERMGLSDVYTMSPEIAIRDQAIKPLYESKTPFEIMMSFSDALIKNGDPDIRLDDFSLRYKNEEDFINEIIAETPGFCNTGKPLPYPDLPEGSLIIGTPDDPGAVLDGKIIKKGERLTVEWLRQHHGVAVWPAGYFRYKRSDGSPSGIYPATSSKRFEFAFSYLAGLNSKFGTDYPTTFYWSGCRWNPQNTLFSDLKREYPFQLITGRVHHAMTMTAVCPYLAETETECMKPLNNDFRYHMPDLENMPNKYGIPAGKQTIFNTGSVSIPVFAFNRADAERIGIETGDLVMLETPFRKSVKGKVYVTDEVIPGVIKTAFGPGGHRSSGIGFVHNTSEYTPNINDLFDPANISGFTGMPGFGDIMVRVIHLKNKGI